MLVAVVVSVMLLHPSRLVKVSFPTLSIAAGCLAGGWWDAGVSVAWTFVASERPPSQKQSMFHRVNVFSHLFKSPPSLLKPNSKRTPARTTTRTRLTPTASRRRSAPSTFLPEEWTPSSCETKSSPRSTTSPSGLSSRYSLKD